MGRSFRFRLNEKLDFAPGQFLQVIFDEKDRNSQSLNKYLSFSSSPAKDYIEVTKRISDSEFSKRLLSLSDKDSILIKAPMGNCVFKDEYRKIGFLIGGIGITPVISILEYIVEKKLPIDACLLYSNRTKSHIAFKAELDGWADINRKIKVVYALDRGPGGEGCFIGKIDNQSIMTNMSDYSERVFFIFGPPKMVTAMQSLCLGIGCSQEMVKTESFIGY